MLKTLLLFTTLFNHLTVFLNLKDTHIEYISYSAKEYVENVVPLEIKINAKTYDLLELQVHFYNINKEKIKNDYFVASLDVKGSKKTIANIPYVLENNMYFNIIINSHTSNKELINIMFPVYKIETKKCYLSKNTECKSDNPVEVIYKDKIYRKWENISLINQSSLFYSNNNKLPLQKLKIYSNFEMIDNLGMLYLEDKNDNIKTHYNERYSFPILLEREKEIVSFKLANKYYLDLINGVTYEELYKDTIYENNLVFPYIEEEYNFKIELDNLFVSFEDVVIDFKVYTNKKLIGECNDSIYCLRRIYR